MCDFISWKEIQKDGETFRFYLTDKEVFSEEGRKKFADCRDNDVLGHGAIDRFFELGGKGREYEIRDFWNLHKLPKEIAEKVQKFNLHWGKMFESGAFQTDDLEYIAANGPKEWAERARKQLEKQRFTLLKEFRLTVPTGYDHAKQLSTLKSKEFYSFNDAITDKNFRNASQTLTPGKTYKVKIFRIGSRVTSEQCLALYDREKGFLTGAQGLSMVYQLKRDELPKGKWTVSFDKKEALWRNFGGGHGVPGVDAVADGGFRFGLGCFEGGWDSDRCVVLFCDCE